MKTVVCNDVAVGGNQLDGIRQIARAVTIVSSCIPHDKSDVTSNEPETQTAVVSMGLKSMQVMVFIHYVEHDATYSA